MLGLRSSQTTSVVPCILLAVALPPQMLQLESAVVNLKAEHAGDESQLAQQQQRIRRLEQQQQQLMQQLEAARLRAEDAQEKAQQCLQVAAAAVVHGPPGSDITRSAGAGAGPAGGNGNCQHSSAPPAGGGDGSAAGVMPGIGADDRLTCVGGLLRDLPLAAQQEIAAQRRMAAAAKRDKVRARACIVGSASCAGGAGNQKALEFSSQQPARPYALLPAEHGGHHPFKA